MNLQEALEVQVGHLLAILHTEELGELVVGDDATLHVGVKAVVGLDVGRHELRHIRLATLRCSGETHERAELGADGAHLEEGVVRTAGLPGGAGLRAQRLGVNLAALLGAAGITLHRLHGLLGLVYGGTEARREVRAQRANVLLEIG